MSGIALSAIALVLVGCGGGITYPELGTVKGKVTQEGRPLADAWIEFQPETNNARTSIAVTNAEGEYELYYAGSEMGARIGTHAVRIGIGGTTDPAAPDTSIPRVMLLERSAVEVKEGENVLDFDVPKPSPRKTK